MSPKSPHWCSRKFIISCKGSFLFFKAEIVGTEDSCGGCDSQLVIGKLLLRRGLEVMVNVTHQC